MKQFIFFNSRLTAKLNQIYYHELTIVSGAPGVGKTYGVSNFLLSSKAEVIWHTSGAEAFDGYLTEFSKIFASWDRRFADFEDLANRSDPAGVAVDVAVRIKRLEERPYRWVYVLEYLENQAPDAVLTFLHYLSCQQIKGFYLILINRASLRDKLADFAWSGINIISEDFFLARHDEIISAFDRNGLAIDTEEANYLYLCSAGYMPALAALFDKMRRSGKGAVYARGGVDLPGFRFSDPEAAREWDLRFDLPPDLWQGLDFTKIRALTNGLDLNRAAIEVERRQIHSDRFSPEWDLCDYYTAILMVHGGQGTAAREWLNAQFSRRVDEARYQSAGRLLALQLLLCLFLGRQRDKRELLEDYARWRLHGALGTSRIMLGLLLRALQSNRTLIAMLSEEQTSNKTDAAWRSFSLAAAYLDIGCIDEAAEHHENAWAMVEATGAYLPAFMFREDAIRLDKLRECQAARRVSASQDYRNRLTAYLRAVRRNGGNMVQHAEGLLTVRESEVAACVTRKMSNREIAQKLNVSENTVKTTLKHVFRKLGVTSRQELQ